jgi:hypothetical protein
MLKEVIPKCLKRCNKELQQLGHTLFCHEQFMKFVNLKTLSVTTVWWWLRLMGFKYREYKKCYYLGGHEKLENGGDLLAFIKRQFEYEHRMCRCVQVAEEEVIELKNLDEGPLTNNLSVAYKDEK